MTIAVVGSRGFNDYDRLSDFLDTLDAFCAITGISTGDADGADALARRYAAEHNLPLQIFTPEWDRFGKRAAFIRNEKIWEAADAEGVAFWDGSSKGTAHSFSISKAQGKRCHIVRCGDTSTPKKSQATLF